MNNKFNDAKYLKSHLQELEEFSKFVRGRLRELERFPKSKLFTKYSYVFNLFKTWWVSTPFKILVFVFCALFILFFITEVFGSIDHAHNPVGTPDHPAPTYKPNIFGRFSLFLGKVDNHLRKAFYYVLNLSIIVGFGFVSWYLYRRFTNIPLDAPFLPRHSDVGVQTQAQGHNQAQSNSQAIQTSDQNAMSGHLGLEGSPGQVHQNLLEHAGQARQHLIEPAPEVNLLEPVGRVRGGLIESIQEARQNPSDPIENSRLISWHIMENIETSSPEEKSRVGGLLRTFTSKRATLTNNLADQLKSMDNSASTEVEAHLRDTLDQLRELDQATLMDLRPARHDEMGVVTNDTDFDALF